MLHYPPATQSIPTSGFLEVLQEFEVKTCLYGHLHGRAAKEGIEGNYKGINCSWLLVII